MSAHAPAGDVMGFANESHCTEHDAGDAALPCPWPECPNGTAEHRVTLGRVTYRRMRNVTDGRVWWTWQLMPRPSGGTAARR